MHTVRNSGKDFNLHADCLLVYGRNKAWFEESPERYIRRPRDEAVGTWDWNSAWRRQFRRKLQQPGSPP